LRSFAIQLIQLDRSLRQYGGETDPARLAAPLYRRRDRVDLSGRAEAGWRLLSETGPAFLVAIDREPAAGRRLLRLEGDLRGLDPQDAMHRRLDITLLNQYELLMARAGG
jgi:hypothetical protein